MHVAASNLCGCKCGKYTTLKHRIFDSKTYNLKYEIL